MTFNRTAGVIICTFLILLACRGGSGACAAGRSVLFSREGAEILRASGTSLEIWDIRKRQKTATLTGHKEDIRALALSPDGSMAATAGEKILFWDTKSWTIAGTLDEEGITDLAFSRNGRWLAASSIKGIVKVWDLPMKGRRPRILRHSYPVLSVAWSPDSLLLASSVRPDPELGPSLEDTIVFWEGSSDTMMRKTDGERFWVNDLAFSPDGKVIASAGYQSRAGIWDVRSGILAAGLKDQDDSLRALDFSRDGRMMVTGGDSTMVSLWKREGEKYQNWIPLWRVTTGEKISSLAMSPDGSTIVTGPSGTVLDARTGAVLATLK